MAMAARRQQRAGGGGAAKTGAAAAAAVRVSVIVSAAPRSADTSRKTKWGCSVSMIMAAAGFRLSQLVSTRMILVDPLLADLVLRKAATLRRVDLDNTLVDRRAAFDTWVSALVAEIGGTDADIAWLLAEDRDGYQPRAALAQAVLDRFQLMSTRDQLVDRLLHESTSTSSSCFLVYGRAWTRWPRAVPGSWSSPTARLRSRPQNWSVPVCSATSATW